MIIQNKIHLKGTVLKSGLACAATLLLLASTSTAAVAVQPLSQAATDVAAPIATTEINGEVLADGRTVFESEQTSLTVLPSTAEEPTAKDLAAKASYITCNLNVEYVHASTHVSGTINGVAKISCNGASGTLGLHYSLVRNSPTYAQWAATSKYNSAQSTIQNNKGVPCSYGPGYFQGWAQGELTPPPGYQVVGTGTSNQWGANRQVACGVGKSAAQSEPEVAETLTVTFVRNDLADN